MAPPQMGQKGPIAVGQRIREARTRRGMTQAQIAKKLGISYQVMQRYERGEKLGVARLFEIAEILDVDAALLLQPVKLPDE